MNEIFRKFAHKCSEVMGRPISFILSTVAIIIWAIAGPYYNYSDTWQLIINTGTTVLTFLMVFLIQNTQNRDARAIHLKLDELIQHMRSARNSFVDLEDLSDAELDKIQKQFHEIQRRGLLREQSKHNKE